MKNVLMITYAYPPVPTIASLRSGKTAKYLPAFGWEPIVLTVNSEGLRTGPEDELESGDVIRTKDFYLYNEIEKITKKFKKRSEHQKSLILQNGQKLTSIKERHLVLRKCYFNMLANVAAFPDPTNGWYAIIRKNHRELLKNRNIDLIFSSSGPFTSHLIARFLKAKIKAPWVADFRDLWSQGYVFKRWFPFNLLERKLEIHTIRKCDQITTVSKSFADVLSLIHMKGIGVVMNGFDEEDYNVLTCHKNKKLTFAYTGNVYKDKQDPIPFFMAIKKILAENVIGENDIVVNFYGRRQEWLEKIVESLKLQKVVHFHGIIPFKECIQKQTESDILLLLHSKNINEKAVIPAKLFEYLGARRPIFAVGCKEGPVNKILSETNAGSTMIETRIIVKNLMECIRVWKTKGYIAYNGKTEHILKYSRLSQTKTLAKIFNRVYQEKILSIKKDDRV